VRPYLIGIAGPSGAGKSTLAHRLAEQLAAPVVSLDSYYRELAHLPLEVRALTNFDEPAALDRELLAAQVESLGAGREVRVPVYDFARHTRAEEVIVVPVSSFVIVEGLFALYFEEVRRRLGTKVFVTAEVGACFRRRLDRDTHERGRTEDSVLTQYESTVRPMACRYVLPTREYADVVVSGTGLLDHSVDAVLEHVNSPRLPAAARELPTWIS
jgi:uridine kinase